VAAANFYPNGVGGTTGDPAVVLKNLWTPGTVWYVYSVSGVDAAAPAGKRREKPLATTAQAITNASAGDMIVWLSGHAESVTVSITANKAGLIFASEGLGTSRARLTAASAINMIAVSAAGVQIANLYCPASTAAPTSRISTNSSRTIVRGCYFECGTSDTAAAVRLTTGAGAVSLPNNSFVSTSTLVTSQPSSGLEVVNAVSDVDWDNVIFDGGASGWSSSALLCTAAVTRLYGTNTDFVNGSVANMGTGSTGWLWNRSASGSAEVIWTS
jgi:hypothetical protein